PLLDGEEGGPALPVEEEDVPRFGDLRHRVDHSPVVPYPHQVGRRGEVAVPDVVVDGLKVPHPPTRGGVERQQRVGEQVGAGAAAAVEVRGGGAGGDEGDAARGVDADARPGVGTTRVAPGLSRPGLVAELSLAGNGVKSPADGAGADVVG